MRLLYPALYASFCFITITKISFNYSSNESSPHNQAVIHVFPAKMLFKDILNNFVKTMCVFFLKQLNLISQLH